MERIRLINRYPRHSDEPKQKSLYFPPCPPKRPPIQLPPPKSHSPGCSPKNPGSSLSPAPPNCTASKKTSEPSPSNSPPTISEKSTPPPPRSPCKEQGIPKNW